MIDSRFLEELLDYPIFKWLFISIQELLDATAKCSALSTPGPNHIT